MNDWVIERTLEEAKFIFSCKATVRDTAVIFGVSKSTVHKDVTERLLKINPLVANHVKEVIDKNKSERHLRGGRATKAKFKEMRCSYENIQ